MITTHQFNQTVTQAHFEAINTLRAIMVEAAAAEPKDLKSKAQFANIRLRAATALLRIKPCKNNGETPNPSPASVHKPQSQTPAAPTPPTLPLLLPITPAAKARALLNHAGTQHHLTRPDKAA